MGRWGEFFDIVEIYTRANVGAQDLVVLCAPNRELVLLPISLGGLNCARKSSVASPMPLFWRLFPPETVCSVFVTLIEKMGAAD